MFVEAYVLSGVMRMAILLFAFQRITKFMGLTQTDSLPGAESDLTINLSKIGWAIQAVSARVPWESACLVQALTGMAMLGRRGINASLYLGVAKDGNEVGAISAHAWLCCGNVVLTGGDCNRYVVISVFNR